MERKSRTLSGREDAAGGREAARRTSPGRPSPAELLSERNIHVHSSSVVSVATQPPSTSEPHARKTHPPRREFPLTTDAGGATQDRCDGRLNRLPPADVYGPGPEQEAARQHGNSADEMNSLAIRKQTELC